jgi:hypothetical protein
MGFLPLVKAGLPIKGRFIKTPLHYFVAATSQHVLSSKGFANGAS